MDFIDYFTYSKEMKKEIMIESKKGGFFGVYIQNFDMQKIHYFFSNNLNDGIKQMNIVNIKNVTCKDKDDERRVKYISIGNQYQEKNLEETINHFQNYYLQVLDLLLENETEQSSKKILKMKKELYTQIFNQLYTDKDNLLFSYFTGKLRKPKDIYINKEMLLIEQSNLSQKKAIQESFQNTVSIIEGPPGTGKTTTILNIIANIIYQNKKAVIVSKNNSAIDNVLEELQNMNLPPCYIRLGNSKVMEELGKHIKEDLMTYKQRENYEDIDLENKRNTLVSLITKLNEKEEKMNTLTIKKNLLEEFQNQLRHTKKKNNAYRVDTFKQTLPMLQNYNNNSFITLKRIQYLSKLLVKLSEDKNITIIDKISTYFTLQKSTKYLETHGVLLHLLLEENYLKALIKELEKMIKKEHFNVLKDEIKQLYQSYIKISKEILIASMLKHTKRNEITRIIQQIEKIERTEPEIKIEEGREVSRNNIIMRNIRKDVLDIYPIVMTTVDSIIFNYKEYFSEMKKIDYIIIDEASQCDILSALPLLYIAKTIIVVGDCKQLSAIINILPEELHYKVKDAYDYINQTFLSTISKSLSPESTLLMEHYRCDYNIINYCNRYFYDNKLIIYKDSKEDAISMITADKGKYVDETKYINEREIKTITEQINADVTGKFIITPFRIQSDSLVEQYNKQNCGTIHTFQGKGEEVVYFSTVLNDTPKCRNHVYGDYNLFTKELINVAVSRAKKKFILVTDSTFFKKHDKNMRDLIEYIEVYGKKIPDKTVCLFDYLYKQIKTYQIKDHKYDNIFEETMGNLLYEYILSHPEYRVEVKLPLANLVTDKQFLNENKDIKQFILNGSHLDFTIYKNGIKKPILVIELDGKYHEEEKQQIRDSKKDKALKHMEIELWRIKSKTTLTQEEFYERLDVILNNK